MPVEVAKIVDDFNKLWPRGTDPVSKADDHIRMIKEVLQLEFELLYNKTRIFSFEKGAVVKPDCILYHEAEKAFYQWNGAYDGNNEYTVYVGSTPETAGGIGGNAWTRSTGSGFMSTVLVSDTVPTNPFQNMLWWDTNSGVFFIYYNDGTSTQWVDLFGMADQTSFNNLLFRTILVRLAAESGYNLVDGSFQEGAVSSGFSDVVLDWDTAKFYQWHLNEAKTVPVGSVPTNIGTEWIDISSYLSKRRIISVTDYGAVADYDIATKTINSNSTDAFKRAISAAKAVNGNVYIPAAQRGKAYYLNDTIYPYEYSGVGTNPSGYYGPMLVGENRQGSYLVIDVPAGAIGIHIYGTSGGPSSMGYKNLTIRPHTVGQGIGICEQGPCVLNVDNIDIQEFDVNLKLSNGTEPGIFTEFGTHKRMWIKNGVTADVQFRKDGGDASFHGANFEDIIINTKSGSIGVDIGAGCNIYNSTWHMNLFGETGATFILNNGARSGDDRIYFEGTASVINNASWVTSGHWRVQNATGVLSDTSTKPFCVSSYITPQTPSDSNLTALGFTTIEATKPLSNDAPSNDFLRLRGSNAEGVAFAGYDGGTFERQGIAMCSWSYGDVLKDITLRSFWHLNGITSFQSAFKLQYNGQAGTQLSINSSGYHTGRMGRVASASISANAGVSQVVTVASSSLPVAGQPCFITLRLTAAGAAHDTVYTYLVASNPYGSSAAATLVASNAFVTGSGFVAPSSVQINSSGLFQFNVTTSLALTAAVNIIGLGVY